MTNVARAFDEQTNVNVLHNFPVNTQQEQSDRLPWETLATGAMPPMMFQVRFSDGKMISFAYGDLHEVHCRDAGHIELFLYSLRKLVITIEGRHLRELAHWFSSAGVQWIQETDPRDRERSETEAEIVKITVEEIPE